MARREIVTVDAPVLRQHAAELTAHQLAAPELPGLIDDMIETMRAAPGAGLGS